MCCWRRTTFQLQPFYWERVHWNSIRNLALGLDIPVGDIASIKALEQHA